MEHFSYSLFLSLIHSLWQAALLVFLYLGANILIKRNNPAYKKNLLFILLAAQFLLSSCTFIIYYTGPAFLINDLIVSNLSVLFIPQSYIESAAPWLSGIYVFVTLWKFAQLIINWQQFKTNGRSAWIKPSVDMKLFTKVKSAEFGIHRTVNLWYSNTINTALTFGFLKPVILLPVALINNLTIAETETLIIHELTHIKNNDYLFNWLLIICETIFFFNPFIKFIAVKIKLEREKNCDTQVLQFNYPALDYAETLLKAARFKTTPGIFFLAAAFKNTQLIKRIQFFTEEKNLHFYKKNYNSLAMAPLMLLLIFNIFLVNFIKNENSLPTGFSQKINTAEGIYKDNMDKGFVTAALQLNKARYSLAKVNNKIRVSENKLTNGKLQTTAKGPELDPVLLDEPEPESLVMPVSLVQPEDSKEIILKEENSATGKAVTKVYKMKFENGKWKTILMWTITETRPASDSLPHVTDTTRYYNYIQ